jgi:hypothetical protein
VGLATVKRQAHRGEHTGSAGLDRQQENVRALANYTQRMLESLGRTHGIGLRRVRMQDKAYTMTPADMEGAFIVITGPLTAARDVLMPRATDASGYGRWFYNFTGQDLTFRNPDGSTQITAADVTGLVVVSADGPEVWT